VKRRGFLAAALAVFALPRIPGVGYAAPLPKLERFVTVPVSDGLRDSTAEIQAAIDRCAPGGIVYFPAGVYHVTKTLDVSRSMTTQGATFVR
jgi:hypothetical protein